MGVAGALLALVIDRRRESGLLRFLGAADAQIRKLILFEAGFLGTAGESRGAVLGVVLSLLLVFVIDKQSFGWTIQFHWPVAVVLGAVTSFTRDGAGRLLSRAHCHPSGPHRSDP